MPRTPAPQTPTVWATAPQRSKTPARPQGHQQQHLRGPAGSRHRACPAEQAAAWSADAAGLQTGPPTLRTRYLHSSRHTNPAQHPAGHHHRRPDTTPANHTPRSTSRGMNEVQGREIVHALGDVVALYYGAGRGKRPQGCHEESCMLDEVPVRELICDMRMSQDWLKDHQPWGCAP